MQQITLGSAVVEGSIYLTPAGEMAIEAPLAMKEYIFNESLAADGKDYLLSNLHHDDTNVSVQMAVINATDRAAALAAIASYFSNAQVTINGHACLYKSISSIQPYGNVVLFTANLIKLAKSQST